MVARVLCRPPRFCVVLDPGSVVGGRLIPSGLDWYLGLWPVAFGLQPGVALGRGVVRLGFAR